MFKFLKKIFRSSDQQPLPAPEPAAAESESAGQNTEAIRAEIQAAAEVDLAPVAPAATAEPAVGPAAPPLTTDEAETSADEPAAALLVEPLESTADVVQPLPDGATVSVDELAQTPQPNHAAPAAAPFPAIAQPAHTASPSPSLSEPSPSLAPASPPPAPLPPLPSPPYSGRAAAAAWRSGGASLIGSALVTPIEIPVPSIQLRERWIDRLKSGLRKTGSNISGVFTGAQITEELYEDLEAALLMADAGVPATQFLLDDVRRRVKAGGATHPVAVRNALVESLTQLLKPLEKELVIGESTPTVIMVAGVNGAGKTTSIGKLTRHLANAGAEVLLAAADTFRAAAREQLAVWADRNRVEIVSHQGADPAAVSFDAVSAGKARGKDVVLVDTAGRLPTQLHLMEELKKIKRVVQKADAGAPHEVLLVIDGNTGQNALAQVKAFDAALALTGLIVTKLDGTAKGGVLAAIAQWGAERARRQPGAASVPVYFIGVGEKLEDLETFNAREFAQALLS